MKRPLLLLLLPFTFHLSIFSFAQGWNSALLTMQGDELVYHPDNDGFVLPDFSHAGYQGGEGEWPQMSVVKTIEPISGDNTAHIQAAIDAVGALPLTDGVRGALLLKAGTYDVSGTLSVPYSGVVIRGEGAAQTVLHATGDTPHQRDVLVIGTDKRIWGGNEQSGTKQMIQDDVVPVGALSFSVADASSYTVGQQIIIFHPCSEAWLAAVNYGGVPYPDPSAPSDPDERWTADQYPVTYHRYITRIEGNTLFIDAPVFYTLRKNFSASYVYVPKMNGTVYGSGVENLGITIESAGGEDENHAWNALRFRSIENAWAVDCEFSGFGQAGLVTEACRRSTFLRCNAVDPVAITTGERKYNFNTYLHSQLNLFQDCYARAGRHNYISNGTSGTSGNVFLRCLSDGALNANEGHRAWTQGMLYDGHKELNMTRTFTLGLYNRVAMGTGHGWAAVHSVLWNCDVDMNYGTIGLQKPPTAQNYAIGCRAKTITGKPVNASDFAIGYVEGKNKTGLEPESLYEAQWRARHGLTPTQTLPVSPEDVWALIPPENIRVFTLDGRCLSDYPLSFVLCPSSLCTLSLSTSFHLPFGILIVCGYYNGHVYTKKILQ